MSTTKNRETAEKALRESEQRLRSIFRTAPIGMGLESDRLVQEANERFCEMTGYTREELVGQSARLLYASDEEYEFVGREKARQVTEQGMGTLETRMRRKDGTIIEVLLSSSPIDAADPSLGSIFIVQDITERKKNEEQIRLAEETYRNIFLNSQVGMFRTDMKTGLILDGNDKMAQFIGYANREELLADKFNISVRYVNPSDREKMISLLEEHGEFSDYEAPFRANDGSIKLMRYSARLVPDRGWIEGVSEDITQEKEIENALKESEEKYRILVESAGETIFVAQDGLVEFTNAKAEELTGYTREEIVGKPFTDFIHPEDRAMVLDRHAQRLQGADLPHDYLFRLVHESGTALWVELKTVLIEWKGRPATLNLLNDVTDRKKAEEQLRVAEETYRNLFLNSQIGLFRADVNTGMILDANDKTAQLLGYADSRELKASQINIAERYFDPNDRAELISRLKENGGFNNAEVRFKHNDGSAMWVRYSARYIPDKGWSEGVVEDISREKEIREALRDSEEKHRILVENAGEVILVAQDGIIKFANVKVEDLSGYTRAEMARKPFIDFIHPDDRRMVVERHLQRLQGAELLDHYPFRILSRSGDVRWVELRTAVISWEGKPATLNLMTDITEHKRAEEALKESEERFRQIVEDTEAGYFFVDREGRFQHVNASWLRLHKYDTPDEIIGRHFSVTQVEEDQEQAKKNVARLLKGESIVSSDFTRRCRDGSIGFHTFSASPVMHGGKVIGLEGFLIDTTEQKRAEQALKESEERFRRLSEAAFEGIIIHQEGVLLNANDRFYEIFGYEPAELLGKQAIPMTIAPEARELVEKQIAAGSLELYEAVGIRKDGTRFPMEIRVREMEYEGRKVRVSAMRDITDRKQAEEQLKESARLTQTLLDGFPCVALLLRPDTREIVASNRAAVEAGAVPGARCFSTWGGREEPCPWCLAPELWEVGQPQHLEIEADGTIWDAYWLPVAEDLYMHYAFDITARKRGEEALRKALVAVEQSPASVMITDLTGKIEYVNPKFFKVTGYAPEEVLGRNPRFLKSGETPPEEYQKLWEAITSGREWRGLFHNKKKDQTLFWEQALIAPVRDASGAVTHFIAVKEDVTAQKILQEQFQQAQKMESVGRLAGGVAHDFNNMLQMILGHCELALEDAAAVGLLRDSLLEIQKAAHRSADLTRQLLAFARKQTAVPEVLDLNDTVAGMLKMLGRLIGEDIELSWVPGHNLWPVKVDPSQVDQILANLAVNARDAIGGAGKVSIETQNVSLDEDFCSNHTGCMPGEYVLLAVSDNGSGIAPEVLEHLFEPFFTTKGVGEGTGLGLATVYGIVKQNDGFIYVESAFEQGTIFNIYLPRFQGAAVGMSEEPVGELQLGRQETVLLVEDEASILEVSQKMLERLGYSVLAARTPTEALRLAHSHAGEIRLLVTDVVMPEMNGRELAEQISDFKPGLKTLFMSGYTSDAIAHRGVLDEGLNFLQKPFSTSDLAAKVRKVLDA